LSRQFIYARLLGEDHMFIIRRYFLFIVSLAVTILLITACGGETVSETPTPSVEPTGRPLVLGDISDEPAETIAGTQPIADYLAANLSDHGITHGVVKIAPDLETMIQWVGDGEVDIYFDSPYPVLVISDETGAVPVLRRFRFGVEEYHSVFFVQKGSDITSLEDMMGQMVAFEEIFSTSGFMLPLSFLISENGNPVEKSSPGAGVETDEIGYVFSTADNTTVQWVVSGVVPIGVVDNVTFGRLPQETQDQLTIIAQTENVPRQLVLFRPGIETELSEAIQQVLLAMDENEAGQAALEAFQTTEFDTLPGSAEAALQQMRIFFELVQDK
jgi:phosphonate transport system substrate-binding protein